MATSNGMKILYVITQGELGGAQRYVRDLSMHFRNNNEVYVANGATGDQWLLEQLSGTAVKTHQFRQLIRAINPLRDMQAFFEIRKYIQEIKPDLIHVNSTKAGVLVAFAKGNVPSIYTVHGWVFNEPMSWLKRQLYIFIEKISCSRHKKIVVLGHHDKNLALCLGIASEKKLIIIPHGIQLNPKSEIRNQKSDTGINLVTVANFYATKGLSYLIAAFKQLARIIPKFNLTIFGDGPERQKLETQIENHPAINLSGRVMHAEKRLSLFDIFVLPSLKEGFPYVILEAMNAEVPIVATTVGEIPNILENEKTALLVKPADAEALATAIQKLIDSPTLRKTLAMNAKKRLADFSFERMTEKHEQVYKNLI